MKDIVKNAKFMLATYTVLGMALVGLGWVVHSSFMATMGVIVVLLGGMIKITIIQNHIIKLMKSNGTWENAEAVQLKSKMWKALERNDIEKVMNEKSASDLIEDERKKTDEIGDDHQ